MIRFCALCRSENQKIYKRLSSLVMIFLLMAIILTAGLVTRFYQQSRWQTSQSSAISSLQQQINDLSGAQNAQAGGAAGKQQELENQLEIARYRQAHHILDPSFNAWSFMQSIPASGNLYWMAALLFALIISSGTVAWEYSDGTVKMLMMRPFRRWKILTAKYLAAFAYCLVLFLIMLLWSAGIGILLWGPQFPVSLTISGGRAVEQASFSLETLAQSYLDSFISVVFYATFAFMIASLFRSQAISVGVSLLSVCVGSMIVGILYLLNFAKGLIKYTPFVCLNFTELTRKGFRSPYGVTLPLAITVVCCYFAGFLMVSYLMFIKRDPS